MENLTLSEFCRSELKNIEREGLLRKLQIWETGEEIRSQGVNFSSNDYLGFSSHSQIVSAFRDASQSVVGAGASRLITGNHSFYELLEGEIQKMKRAEAAVVFTSGYAAAIGAIPALVGSKDFIIMDKLCHACLVDGARLSGATIRVFPHGNLKRCEELLKTCKSVGGKILLVTESVFSMDGDLAALDDLVELKKKYEAWLMVDEAHGTGVMGKTGRGGAEYFGVDQQIDISMGTLSKALGCVGGFICGSKELREFLINRARSLIYSTGLPPAVCAAGAAACRLSREDRVHRDRLWENVKLFGRLLDMEVQTPIVPIMIGDERKSVDIASNLRKEGFMVPAIRYPTVGRGKARLRVSLSAKHSVSDVEKLAEHLLTVRRSLSL